MKRFYFMVVMMVFAVVLSASSCFNKSITSDEAKAAVDEISVSSQALNLASSSIEIATDFTIGEAVENAVQEIKEFIESQLPCASITVSDATLTIEYGAYPEEECTYNGHEFSGMHSITVASTAAGNLVVEHHWTDFTNGLISVTGQATVTWSSAESSRKIEHALEFTRFSDGKTATTNGIRTQTALAQGIDVGISVDGSVDWVTKTLDQETESEEEESEENEWYLDIDNVEMRWIDPVPQSGMYTLDTPFDKTVEISFQRVDEDTIAVTVSSGDKTFTFDVSKLGGISEG